MEIIGAKRKYLLAAALSSGIYESPSKLQFRPSDYFPLIGSMKQGPTKHCTVFNLAPQLIVSNAHCVSTQSECRRSSFHYWNADEKNWLGRVRHRSFSCDQIIFVDASEDIVLLLSEKDPSDSYGTVRVLRSPSQLDIDTPVVVLSQNPLHRKKSNFCRTGVPGKKTKTTRHGSSEIESMELYCNQPVSGGDSGSPVFNYQGDLVGLLWGRDLAVPNTGVMVPITTLLPNLEREAAEFEIEWVDRNPEP